jgi:hypothetical protein
MALGNGLKRNLEGKSADCKQFNLGEIQSVWISTFHLARGGLSYRGMLGPCGQGVFQAWAMQPRLQSALHLNQAKSGASRPRF